VNDAASADPRSARSSAQDLHNIPMGVYHAIIDLTMKGLFDVRTVTIDLSSCDRSPACPARRACPRGAIIPVAGGPYPGALGYTIDEKRCTGCAVCALSCPGGAVRVG